jgi:hypothetical protein
VKEIINRIQTVATQKNLVWSILYLCKNEGTDNLIDYLEDRVKMCGYYKMSLASDSCYQISWNYLLTTYCDYWIDEVVFEKLVARGACNFNECLEEGVLSLRNIHLLMSKGGDVPHHLTSITITYLLNLGTSPTKLITQYPDTVQKLVENKNRTCQWLQENMTHLLCPQIITYILIPCVAYETV